MHLRAVSKSHFLMCCFYLEAKLNSCVAVQSWFEIFLFDYKIISGMSSDNKPTLRSKIG